MEDDNEKQQYMTEGMEIVAENFPNESDNIPNPNDSETTGCFFPLKQSEISERNFMAETLWKNAK